MVRCPGGSQDDCFFQKHHADSLGDDVHADVRRLADEHIPSPEAGGVARWLAENAG